RRSHHSFLHDALPISIIAIVVLIPLITVGLWEFYMLPSLEKLAQGGATLPATEATGKAGVHGELAQTYEFNDIVANLSGSLKSRSEEHTSELQSRENL